MKKVAVLLVFIFSGIMLSGQVGIVVTDTAKTESGKFVCCLGCQEMPQFIWNGGIQKYMKDSIHYPAEEKKNNIEGTVYVRFTIEIDGSITNVSVEKGIDGYPAFTTEVIRVITQMPKWKPAMQDGKPIRTEMRQPVKFTLEKKE